MANTKHKFSLRLLIDEEKNRVVLAEAGKDFVDVLCSLLTLPMGTIVRLLEKHQSPQSSTVGCFHNLYKSVSEMNAENFKTQDYKKLLMFPRNLKESHCRKLKMNVDVTGPNKFFLCPNFSKTNNPCCKLYSNINNSSCSCGGLRSYEFNIKEGEQVDGFLVKKADGDGVFISCRTSFIITDDLKVALNSMGLVLNVLNGLGYAGFDKLQEMLIDVGFEEVLTLLGCLFTSETPLTDTFMRKHCVTRKRKLLTPLAQETIVAGDADKLLTLKVYVRKTYSVILYAECREDFVDFLFAFLAIPLEFAWELSIDTVNIGCVGNLCRSVKELSFEKPKETAVSKCKLPCYYNISAQLLDIVCQEGADSAEYECLVTSTYDPYGRTSNNFAFARKIRKDVLSDNERIVKLTPMIPKDGGGVGFVKGETNFIVSDDLSITPMNSSSTISLLSKLQMNISDIDEQVINIGKSEAVSLLRASLITSNALTNGLSSFLSMMKPEDSTTPSSKILKSD